MLSNNEKNDNNFILTLPVCKKHISEIRFFSFLSPPKGFGVVRVCVGSCSFSNLVVDGGDAGS